jgi:hypothetical protein
LGLAAAARSSSGIAVLGEAVRFPFPRFRVLPCRALDAARSLYFSRLAPGPAPGRPSVFADGLFQPPTVTAHADIPAIARGLISRAGMTAAHASELVKMFVLAMLVAANGLVLAARRKIGRLRGH